MNAWLSFQHSIRNLLTARLRSILAILGILVGTGSVVALLYTGNMATEHALAQFKSLGTNILSINISSSSHNQKDVQTKQPALKDMPIIQASSRSVDAIAPYASSFKSIKTAGKSINGGIVGITNTFPKVMRTHLKEGRYVNEWDRHNHFAVAGIKLAQSYKKSTHHSIMGHQVQVGDVIYTVVGILKPWRPSYLVYLDIDKSLLVPLPSLLASSAYAKLNQIVIRLKPDADIDKSQTHLSQIFKHLYPKARIRFRNPKEVINIITKPRRTLSLLLTAIAGISLLVGGIGVMNIMLVSVTERRREIGLLMAIGATRKDILSMFLIESILLTLIGGLIGIIVGVGIALGIGKHNHWEIFFYSGPIILGFLVSTCVGILSGFYPALRASSLDPIRVLHAE